MKHIDGDQEGKDMDEIKGPLTRSKQKQLEKQLKLCLEDVNSSDDIQGVHYTLSCILA